MRSDVVVAALEAVVREGNKRKRSKRNGKPWTIYLSPRGKKLTQIRVEQLAKKHEWLILLCGHYEGIDQRIISGGWIDEEISIGDYVLTGGRFPVCSARMPRPKKRAFPSLSNGSANTRTTRVRRYFASRECRRFS